MIQPLGHRRHRARDRALRLAQRRAAGLRACAGDGTLSVDRRLRRRAPRMLLGEPGDGRRRSSPARRRSRDAAGSGSLARASALALLVAGGGGGSMFARRPRSGGAWALDLARAARGAAPARLDRPRRQGDNRPGPAILRSGAVFRHAMNRIFSGIQPTRQPASRQLSGRHPQLGARCRTSSTASSASSTCTR